MLFYSIVVFILVVKNKFANTSPIANKGLDNVRYQLDNEDEYTFKDYKKEAEVFDQILRANKEATGLDDGLLFEGDIEITGHKTDYFMTKKINETLREVEYTYGIIKLYLTNLTKELIPLMINKRSTLHSEN